MNMDMKRDKAPAIETAGLGFSIDGHDILSGIDLRVMRHQWIGLIGPNGCGKSTLLKNIYRQYQPSAGAVYVNGDDVRGLKNKALARRMAVLAQENNLEFDFTVREIVAMGRYAHRSFLQAATDEDDAVCAAALETVGMSGFAERSFLSLSGGEKQRVYMAMAFAQQSEILILDEPTNHLDIGYQLHLMDTLRQQQRDRGVTVFTSIHDMDLAAAYCDRIIMMDRGRIVAQGLPEEVLQVDLIQSIFHVDVEVTTDSETGRRRVRYLRYHFDESRTTHA